MIAACERAGVEAGKQIFGVFQKSDSRQRLSVGLECWSSTRLTTKYTKNETFTRPRNKTIEACLARLPANSNSA